MSGAGLHTRRAEKQRGQGDALGRRAASRGMRTSLPGDTEEDAGNPGAWEASPGLHVSAAHCAPTRLTHLTGFLQGSTRESVLKTAEHYEKEDTVSVTMTWFH